MSLMLFPTHLKGWDMDKVNSEQYEYRRPKHEYTVDDDGGRQMSDEQFRKEWEEMQKDLANMEFQKEFEEWVAHFESQASVNK